MKKHFSYLLLFSLLYFGSSYANSTLLSAGQKIDVIHIVNNLRFDWNKKQVTGKTIIQIKLLESLKEVYLDAKELNIHTIKLSGERMLKFIYTADKKGIIVQLGKLYYANEQISLQINYHTNHHNDPDPNLPGGTFGKGIRFFIPNGSNPIKRKQAWSQGEPDGNSYWFPCIESLQDLRTTEFFATVDQEFTAISNGTLKEIKVNPGKTKTFHYKTEIPYANYLTAFVVGQYSELQQEAGNVLLHTYCYKDETKAAKATITRLPDMLKFITAKCGYTFPFKHYAQVMIQDYPFPGLTGQNGFSSISDNMIDDEGTHADFLYLWDGVEFNALASQWFGNLIMPEQWSDIWLAKSFAQYFEGLYTDSANGKEEYLLWYHPWELGSVLADWNNSNRHPIVTDHYSNLDSFINDSYSKYKGALVLRMLRKEVGDKAFFNAIHNFITRYAFKPAGTKDFQNMITEACGKDMQWFFDQWIFSIGHPVFEVSNNYDVNSKQLHLTVKQSRITDSATIYPVTGYFKGKVSVSIDNVIHEIELEAKEENGFTFQLNQQPNMIHFDAEDTWIKEIKYRKSPDELLYQFEHDHDATGRQFSMTELVAIVKNEKTTVDDKNRIINSFQHIIQSSLYWRVRFNALSQLRSIQQLPYDSVTIHMLLDIIRKEKSWLKSSAITMLGMTGDQQYADLYISLLNDYSDRVINAAAIALGKSKSSKAFDALIQLKDKPSWKNQSLMHSMNGLTQLGDRRAVNIALDALKDNRSPRWFLGNAWDYPVVAVQTLYALGETSKAHDIIFAKFEQALKSNDKADIFNQVLLIALLADPKGKDVFIILREKFKNDANTMIAINNYEQQFNAAFRK